jgi:hypothetical protein
MLIRAIIILLIWLTAWPVHAAPGIAVVQSLAPTSDGGTQDFTSSGFGTPLCAMFFASYGTANGTVVDHAGLFLGFSDFTNHQSVEHASEDTGAASDTGGNASSTNALRTLLATNQAVDSTAIASTITDGARLTWADAPPSAYRVTAVLFNSSAISNCAVGSVNTAPTIGGTASVSGLGWQPDLVLAITNNGTTGNARASIGVAVYDGGIVQYAAGQDSQNASSPSDVYEVMRADRLALNPLGITYSSSELTSFDAGGFTLTTRDATTVNIVRYLTAKLASGIAVKLAACLSPTATGAHSCTGAGWTPQAGIMIHTVVPALGTYYIAGANNESYGVSAFTASSASSASIADDDGDAATNTESMTDNKPVRLRKDAADFMTATVTGFQSNGVDFNYTATDATARYRALLLFQAAASTSSARPRWRLLLP